ADPNNRSLKERSVIISKEYSTAVEDELKLLHQKARVNWLKEGDKNSAYFHSILRTRKNKSRVELETICKEDGTRVDIIKIKATLFDIDSSKVVGPDAFTSCFFKKAWNCIGKDIFLAVKEFFQNGKLLGEINATLIALVPKIDTPDKLFGFRPIACCNVLLCISKILTNRIKDGYNRKNEAKRCAMNIDVQKAYDTVNRDFIRSTLQLVGFHEVMIKWIMTCVTTASFSVYINGTKDLDYQSLRKTFSL
nr:hypothetical protein [Tanacetum cinerariifolium]